MAKLYRPHIPISVRVQVAARQIRTARPAIASSLLYGLDAPSLSDGHRLKVLLRELFGDRPVALDHDPALVNRKRYVRNGKTFYQPPANDPAHLIYREAGPGSDHDIKTRVRGDGAKRSDLGQARYNKRAAKNRSKHSGKHNGAHKSASFRAMDGTVKKIRRVSRSIPKRKWPSRPFQSKVRNA